MSTVTNKIWKDFFAILNKTVEGSVGAVSCPIVPCLLTVLSAWNSGRDSEESQMVVRLGPVVVNCTMRPWVELMR